MNQYLISPDDCLILKAMKESRSLREAALALNCDPAGLARNIRRLADTTGFIQKVENKWMVTTRGLDLVVWAEESLESQKQVLESKSSLRIAATTWLSEAVLIPRLKDLKENLGAKTSLSLSVPNHGFEEALRDGSVDFVIACHPPEAPEIEHRQIAKEEWIVIVPKSWKASLGGNTEHPIEKLSRLPYLAHQNLNPDSFLPNMKSIMKADYGFDNLTGIRTAVLAGLGWSFVPKILVERSIKAGELIQLPLEMGMSDRKICLWWLRNRIHSKRVSNQIISWLKEAVRN